MINPETGQADVDLQYRTLITLWAALLMSVVIYFILTLVLVRPAAPENRTLTIALSVLSAFSVVVSFAVKRKLLSRSVDSQDIRLVKTGSVITWAICEAAALFGLVDFFVTQDRYYFVLMAFAFLGLLLHFPRRSQLVAASFKIKHPLN